MNKALNYIGIAKKAGAIEIGETNAGAAIRAGKGRVLVVAADASDNAKHRAENFVYGRQTPLVILPFTKSELSEVSGTGGCSMAAFTDVGLAAFFMAALAENEPSFRETAELLAQKNNKALMRKREALAHEKNRKTGKAVKPAGTGKRRKNI
ncbi:MAG: 50S ribosomal protein L7 [Clostridia bacterium]|nr:50S ribosomal protein L7 [Clostridia bacterium]